MPSVSRKAQRLRRNPNPSSAAASQASGAGRAWSWGAESVLSAPNPLLQLSLEEEQPGRCNVLNRPGAGLPLNMA